MLSGKDLQHTFLKWDHSNHWCYLKHLTRPKEKKKTAQWSQVYVSDESTFCISFGNHIPWLWRKSGEAQNPMCFKALKPQCVMTWGAMSSAAVDCGCSSVLYRNQSKSSRLPGDSTALYVFIRRQPLWRCQFLFQQGLALGHSPKTTTKWFCWSSCYCVWLARQLAWPEVHREPVGQGKMH